MGLVNGLGRKSRSSLADTGDGNVNNATITAGAPSVKPRRSEYAKAVFLSGKDGNLLLFIFGETSEEVVRKNDRPERPSNATIK
mmetsp:Transcript_26416/g.29650  ORF Transcript_26416/g.29650 Transcript_26416/m.29650 type:complete len:84 (+) Transcript_26416:630-881(+)